MKLVNLSDFGIRNINYYWERKERYNLTEVELAAVGLINGQAQVDESIIPKLKMANELLKPFGFELIVKDAYRSKELYELIRKKRYEIDGQFNTDKTFSQIKMSHSTGLAVDVSLIDLKTELEVDMWDKLDWPDGIFINYYKLRQDPESKKYQELQDLLIGIMLKVGFKLGPRKEFHHFESIDL